MFCKKSVLRNFEKFAENHLHQGLFLICRAGQSILVVREVLFLFTIAAIEETEKAETLRESLITFTNSLQIPVCVRVNEAPAFQSLSKCPILNELGIIYQSQSFARVCNTHFIIFSFRARDSFPEEIF